MCTIYLNKGQMFNNKHLQCQATNKQIWKNIPEKFRKKIAWNCSSKKPNKSFLQNFIFNC